MNNNLWPELSGSAAPIPADAVSQMRTGPGRPRVARKARRFEVNLQDRAKHSWKGEDWTWQVKERSRAGRWSIRGYSVQDGTLPSFKLASTALVDAQRFIEQLQAAEQEGAQA